MTSAAPTSVATARAVVFVAERRERAEALGRDLAEYTNDPDGLVGALRLGFGDLADPDYLEGQHRVAPGLGAVHGIRWPLLAAVERGFSQSTNASFHRR